MVKFDYVDFEDGYGRLPDLSFSDMYVWIEDYQQYAREGHYMSYARKMYDACRDNIFANFCKKLINYDENLYCDVNIQDKFVIVTVYSDYGHGQYPTQFNFRFKKSGDISIHLG